MTSNMKARICLAAIGLTLSGVVTAQTPSSFINDSTSARYRYEVYEHSYAQIPVGVELNELDVLERNTLTPSSKHVIVSQGVNENYEPYLQIQTLEDVRVEDWLNTPELTLITPTAGYGFNSTGEIIYHFPHTDIEMQRVYETADFYESSGYMPIMLFFPQIDDEFVGSATSQGAELAELSEYKFKLIWPDREITFDVENSTIEERYIFDSEQVFTRTEYHLFDPYGYVIKSQYSETVRTDILVPATFVSIRTFENHVVEDPFSMIPKYTDLAGIEVRPVPVEEYYEIVLNGIPEEQVTQVQVRDYMGNIVYAHSNPEVSGNIINLDGSQYPSGMLIILVHTTDAIYSQTITKS